MKSMTLCWDCRNATEKDCEWSRDFKPVEGWVAEETFKKGAGTTYIVYKCPKFIRDSWHYGQYRTKEEYKKYLTTKEKNERNRREKEKQRIEAAKKVLEESGMIVTEVEK